MGNQGTDLAKSCPVEWVARIIGDKWTLLIIRDLAKGAHRFNQLHSSIAGISTQTLTIRLNTLEQAGLVLRRAYPEIPPRVEYSLTEKGRALIPLLVAIRDYGEQWLHPVKINQE